MQTQMQTDIMTIREIADYLKLTEKTAYRLTAEGKIPGFKVGGSWRFRRSEIEQWIDATAIIAPRSRDLITGRPVLLRFLSHLIFDLAVPVYAPAPIYGAAGVRGQARRVSQRMARRVSRRSIGSERGERG